MVMNPILGPEANVKLVEEFLAAWNASEMESAIGMLTEDAVWDDPAMPAPAKGRQAARAFAEAVLVAFPDFAITLRGPVCVSLDGAAWTVRTRPCVQS